MLRNIPNKCTQEQLKALVDKSIYGRYDFTYSRIDFANECTVCQTRHAISLLIDLLPSEMLIRTALITIPRRSPKRGAGREKRHQVGTNGGLQELIQSPGFCGLDFVHKTKYIKLWNWIMDSFIVLRLNPGMNLNHESFWRPSSTQS